MKQITIEKLSFQYNKNQKVIKNISFEVNKGSIFSILGRSGSGKSTILKIIASLLKNKGNQKLEGNISIFKNSPEFYRKKGELSFMFQEPSLMPNLTIRENVLFPLKLRQKKIDENEIDELLILVGLKKYENYFPSELSGGMKTRVSLARSFVTKPKLLLLDEPFTALDIAWRLELYEYLEKIRKKYNTTIILVSHDIQEVVLLANKIFVISADGEKIKELEVSQIHRNRIFDYKHVNIFLEKNQELFFSLQSYILKDEIKKTNNYSFNFKD